MLSFLHLQNPGNDLPVQSAAVQHKARWQNVPKPSMMGQKCCEGLFTNLKKYSEHKVK